MEEDFTPFFLLIVNDDMMKSVMELSGGKNRTEGLIIAPEGYVYQKKIDLLIKGLRKNPIKFFLDLVYLRLYDDLYGFFNFCTSHEVVQSE